MSKNLELKSQRARRGWNQRVAARRARIGLDRYVRIELGYTEPGEDEQDRLARLFGVPVDQIFPARKAAEATS